MAASAVPNERRLPLTLNSSMSRSNT